MSIRSKMTLLFLSIVTILLFAFCTAIYFESEIYRQQEYKTRLRQEAITAATILFKKEEISPDLLKLLAKNQMTVLNQEEIVIYNQKNQIIYQNSQKKDLISPQTLSKIRQQKELFWEQNEVEKFGQVFKTNQQEFIVLASAFDKYGLRKQQNLALMLIIGGLLMLVISAVFGWFFAGGLLFPIQKIIKKIDNINVSHLELRLDTGNEKDELAQLSIRFNQMIDRLQKAFQNQKAFVAHASHELRTPLTAITGQIQVSLLAKDNADDLRLMAKSVLDDVQQLNKLTNNLLDLTSIDAHNTEIKLALVNVLELLWQVRIELLKKHSEYHVLIELDESPDILPEIYANEGLLYTVLINLIDNGAKFSNTNTVNISLKISENSLKILFQNDGPAIPKEELAQIFEPFRRGTNARKIKGHGVGLSLTKRILQLHQGEINVISSVYEGTLVMISLPKKEKN